MLKKLLINNTKKVMQYTDIQYIRCIILHQNTSIMHDLHSNFRKFFDITKSVFKNRINQFDNFFDYRNPPKMSDCQIIALAITGESLGIDSESYFWGKLKSDHAKDFPNLIDRSNFNRRRKRLYPFLQELNQTTADYLNQGETVFIVDSIPIPVCQIARERQSKICKESFETAPDKGFSSVSKSYYYGYKLHLVTSMNGIFYSMDLSKASVHDVHYLTDIKNSGLNNCLLLADKGYLSSTYQLDLFSFCHVELQTPKRANQNDYKPYPVIFRRIRKRIETLFAQLCDQFMLKRNYAKSILGLSVRILSKITAVTLLQYINLKNDKPLNHLKYALAS
jgi:penicillin-binding protein-related factor A (putative recombinase)